MALLWMDGFDHYGVDDTGRANMLAGAWAEISTTAGGVEPRSSQSRTGLYSLFFPSNTGDVFARRVLGKSTQVVGVGFAVYLTQLPSSNSTHRLVALADVTNTIHLTLGVESTGAMTVKRGRFSSGTVLYTTPTPVLVAEAFNHIELRAYIDNASGAVEVRVNGVTVISLTDIDTQDTANTEVSQISFGKSVFESTDYSPFYIDDVFVWDDTGTTNNDFLGDRRVRTIYPNADTAVAEWSVTGAASGFAAINQTSPDGDTTYIEADTSVPVTSEFGLQDLPASTGAIAAIQTYVMQRKTEAGDGSTQTSLISGASVANGADRPITEVYTYWMDVFETDPATGSAWTKAGVDDVKLRIRRTA